MTPQDKKSLMIVAAIVIVILALAGIGQIVTSINSKDYPPPACEIFGGNWNIFQGWQCK